MPRLFPVGQFAAHTQAIHAGRHEGLFQIAKSQQQAPQSGFKHQVFGLQVVRQLDSCLCSLKRQ